MKKPFRLLYFVLAGCASLCLSACISFKSAQDTSRHFLLAPMAGTAKEASPAPSGRVSFGLGKVRIPAHLLRDQIAVRQSANEVDYLENALWAERLDNGLQRVLAQDLACLVATDKVRLSAWGKEEVQLEIYVSVVQFDVDAQGSGTISAWWRILSPGGDRPLMTGQSNHTRKGPAPTSDPQGAVATLSLLAEDLSRDLAQAIASQK